MSGETAIFRCPDWPHYAGPQASRGFARGVREIYVLYREGIGRSKLKIPAAGTGNGRNMNTIAKLVKMAAET